MTLPRQLGPAERGALLDDRLPTGDAGRLRALELLSDVALRVASVDVAGTLDAVVRAVVDVLGFDAAVLNLVEGDTVPVAALHGPQEIRDALWGTAQPRELWDRLLERSTPLGALRFVDGRSGDDLDGLLTWVPDLDVPDDPRAWHPWDALFAPLRASSGELVGVLSVDLPRDGRRPTTATVELLERFAVLAALAIERARMHERVARAAELFHRTFEDAPLGMAVLTPDGRVEQVNATYAELARQDRELLPGAVCWELVHPDDRDAVRTGIRQVATGELPLVTGYVRNVTGERWASVTASRLDGPDGPRLLVQVLDVTDQRRATESLRAQAVRDPLTGLRNRAGLLRHLGELLQDGRSGRVAVLFCDLDRFKLVNDTRGHAVGDELIVHVARALQAELRGDDVAARLGGDEFVVVLADCDGPTGAIAAAERIRAAVGRPVVVGGGPITPSLSLGIALSERGSTVDGLLADADSALYRAKESGRGRWELFAAQMRDENVARLRLREELRRAVADDQLRLHYQPIVDLVAGRVRGYEALLRWQHPERGLLPPGAFLGELLHGDLAASVHDWVVERAAADAASWSTADGDAPFVTVNVSPDQLGRPDLPARVLAALSRHGVDPDRLWIEITEEAVVADEAQLSALHALRGAGVHVALDDFGSGYAGLLSLRRVPADVVKLDRGFTLELQEGSEGRTIVESVVRLCSALGRTIVAEGLETAEHVAGVRDLGVRLGQGWHLGRPGPLASTGPVGPVPATAGVPATADLTGELRRLDAALAVAHDEVEIGRVALQAAKRVAGVAGGSLVLPAGPCRLRAVHVEGYPQELVERMRLLRRDAPLPLCTAVRDAVPVWLGAAEMAGVLHDVVPPERRTHVALAALPLLADGAAVGGLGVSWDHPVELDEVARTQLVELARHVARRLAELAAGRRTGDG